MSLLMCTVPIDRRKQGGDAHKDHTHASAGGDTPKDHTDISAAIFNHPNALEVRVLFEGLVLVSSVHLNIKLCSVKRKITGIHRPHKIKQVKYMISLSC